MNDFFIIWNYNGSVVTGEQGSVWINDPIYFPISYPNTTTSVYQATIQTSALQNSTMETITGVQFYLDGPDIDLQIVRDLWPSLASTSSPPRADLSGGIEISFDNGNTFTRFASSVGNKDIPGTWLALPALATSSGVAGQIGPYDIAKVLLRWIIPPMATEYKLFNISLNIDCDVR